ncbi:MAG: transposase [Treponema sp.]|nr:transposase [Treponema sp.]
MRTAGNEGAKSWTGVLNEIKNRGVRDIFTARTDGPSGIPCGPCPVAYRPHGSQFNQVCFV